MAELELKEVSYFYESGGKRIDILDKASYSFEKGTLYTIVGPSGSGKTTTLTLAGALEEPKSGCVCFEGKDIREIGYTAGVIFSYPLANVIKIAVDLSNGVQAAIKTQQIIILYLCGMGVVLASSMVMVYQIVRYQPKKILMME